MKQNSHEWITEETQKILRASRAVVLVAVIVVEEVALELGPENKKFFLRRCKEAGGPFKASGRRRNQCELAARARGPETHSVEGQSQAWLGLPLRALAFKRQREIGAVLKCRGCQVRRFGFYPLGNEVSLKVSKQKWHG